MRRKVSKRSLKENAHREMIGLCKKQLIGLKCMLDDYATQMHTIYAVDCSENAYRLIKYSLDEVGEWWTV